MIHPKTSSHRLHRLPRTISQQATHIQLALDPLIRPPNRTIQHFHGELDQPRTHLLDLLRSHTTKSTVIHNGRQHDTPTRNIVLLDASARNPMHRHLREVALAVLPTGHP